MFSVQRTNGKVLANAMVVITLQIVSVQNQHTVHLKLTQCSMIAILQSWKKSFFTSSPTETFSSAQFSSSVVSNSLRPHESQHARPPCPSQTPGVYPNSCPSS